MMTYWPVKGMQKFRISGHKLVKCLQRKYGETTDDLISKFEDSKDLFTRVHLNLILAYQISIKKALKYKLEEIFDVVQWNCGHDDMILQNHACRDLVGQSTVEYETSKVEICCQSIEGLTSSTIIDRNVEVKREESEEEKSKEKKKKESEENEHEENKKNKEEISVLSEPVDNSRMMQSTLNPYAEEFIMKDEVFLKKIYLYNIMPAVSRDYLSETFENNRCNLEETFVDLRNQIKENKHVPIKEFGDFMEVTVKKEVFNSDEWVHNLVDCGFETDVIDVIDLHYAHQISTEAQRLRNSARKHFLDYQTELLQAMASYKIGDRKATLKYTHKRTVHQEKFWKLNKTASQLIVHQNNEGGELHILNVNGLSVSETIFYVHKFLKAWKLMVSKLKQFVIIKVALCTCFVEYKMNVFSAIISYLNKNNYRYKKSKDVIQIKIKPLE